MSFLISLAIDSRRGSTCAFCPASTSRFFPAASSPAVVSRMRYGDALAWVEAPSEADAVRRSLDLYRLGDWTDDVRVMGSGFLLSSLWANSWFTFPHVDLLPICAVRRLRLDASILRCVSISVPREFPACARRNRLADFVLTGACLAHGVQVLQFSSVGVSLLQDADHYFMAFLILQPALARAFVCALIFVYP